MCPSAVPKKVTRIEVLFMQISLQVRNRKSSSKITNCIIYHILNGESILDDFSRKRLNICMSQDFSHPSLPAISWVAHLKQDDRDLLSSYGEFIPAHVEKPIITEGEKQSFLYFVISGSLKVMRSGEKGEHVIATVHAGESLGEISVFDPGPASATVIPLEFSQLWRINQRELMNFIRDNSGAANQLLVALVTTLSQRLRRLDPLLVNFIDKKA